MCELHVSIEVEVHAESTNSRKDDHHRLEHSERPLSRLEINGSGRQQPYEQRDVRNPLRERLCVPEESELDLEAHDPDYYQGEQELADGGVR